MTFKDLLLSETAWSIKAIFYEKVQVGKDHLYLSLPWDSIRVYDHYRQTCLLVYISQISGGRLHDHWSSG